MRALVTGGAGLIGSHLVDLLLAEGWEVRILDILEPQTHPDGVVPPWTKEQRAAGVEFLRSDIRDGQAMENHFARTDVVFHQAAFGGFSPDPRKMIEVNTLGTANVLTSAANAGVSKVVVASSQAVYGGNGRDPDALARGEWGGDLHPRDRLIEGDHLTPRTPYAISKYAAERLAIEGPWPMPVVALRYALTYGPRQSVSNPYTGICSIFATRLRSGLPPVIYEDGMQTRDFVYVGDVAAANLLVALDSRADGEVFNVGTGIPTSVLYFAKFLAATFGHGGDFEPSGDYRPQDARHVVTDPSKLKELGWKPRTNLLYGLGAYAEWFREQPWVGESFTAAEAELRELGIVVGS